LAAGFYNRTTEDEVREMISEAGYSPIQRLTNYDLVEGSAAELTTIK
jgi:2-iminoacetate synthase ThiH